jgi:hypothetical protein
VTLDFGSGRGSGASSILILLEINPIRARERSF